MGRVAVSGLRNSATPRAWSLVFGVLPPAAAGARTSTVSVLSATASEPAGRPKEAWRSHLVPFLTLRKNLVGITCVFWLSCALSAIIRSLDDLSASPRLRLSGNYVWCWVLYI